MRVVPVRFTDDSTAMRRFFEALGLEPVLTSDSGGWIELRAAGGGMALHGASSSADGSLPGTTGISFESDEPLEQVGRRLRAAGFEPTLVDESWGRQLLVQDPDGVVVTVNENSADLYGYTRA